MNSNKEGSGGSRQCGLSASESVQTICLDASAGEGDPRSDAHAPAGGLLLDAWGAPLPVSWLRRIVVIWCGQAASIFATCAASFAAIWYITETTSSPVWLSLAAASSLLPVALLSPFGGVAADRFNRKMVMIVADGTAGLFSLALAVIIVFGQANVPMVLLLLAVRAAAQAFHGPALSAVMPRLVPEVHLVRINAMDQALTSLSSIAGPVLGIFLYVNLGLPGVLALDAVCAAVACMCLGLARIPSHAPSCGVSGEKRSVLGDIREGTLFIWRDKSLRSLMVLVMVAMLLFMPASSLSPLMVYDHFGGDGCQASIVEAVFGLGLLLGSVLIIMRKGSGRLVPVLIASGVVLGLSLAACGLLDSGQFAVYAALIGVTAAAMGCFNAPVLPMLQKRTPEDKMGRVMGIFLMGSSLAAPVGLSFSGFAANAVGVPNWFIICGVAVALTCALAYAVPSIRAIDDDGR